MSCFRNLLGGSRAKVKPCKVQDVGYNRRTGIAAKSLQDLQKKVCQKFEVRLGEFALVLEDDGTEVDEEQFFSELPEHQIFILVREGEQWRGRCDLLRVYLEQLLASWGGATILDEVNKLMAGNHAVAHMEILGKLAASAAMNIKSETRKEDPEWFEDLSTKYQTKDAYMKEKAKSRVRGYYYHAKDYIQKSPVLKGRSRQNALKILVEFQDKLKANDYYSGYFARKSGMPYLRYCDTEGWFTCMGRFDEECCSSRSQDHLINPYGSRQTRILFSTWELDHRIEKSREVLPCMVEAARSPPKGWRIDGNYFYSLLFTRDNLKLVHPVCHDKSEHTSAGCDQAQVYIEDS